MVNGVWRTTSTSPHVFTLCCVMQGQNCLRHGTVTLQPESRFPQPSQPDGGRSTLKNFYKGNSLPSPLLSACEVQTLLIAKLIQRRWQTNRRVRRTDAMVLTGESVSNCRKKHVQVPLCLPQIPVRLFWFRDQWPAESGQRLTACHTKVRPIFPAV